MVILASMRTVSKKYDVAAIAADHLDLHNFVKALVRTASQANLKLLSLPLSKLPSVRDTEIAVTYA
jgi:hypothetical protein